MKKSLFILMLLLVGCAQNPADNAPAARIEPAAGQPAATAPSEPPAGQAATPAPAEPTTAGSPVAPLAGTRYAFDPQTSKITWKGSKVTRTHDGGFRSFSGEIGVVDGDPTKSSVHVEIQADSIYADEQRLTDHLKSPDFFDVQQFPTASFHSTAIVRKGEAYEVTGDLAMHGVTKSVTFPARIELKEDGVEAEAEFAIPRKDWGIVYPGMANDLIRNEVLMKLDIEAKAAAGGGSSGIGASPGAGQTGASPTTAP